MNLMWAGDAWNDYCSWQSEDKKTLKKINELIKDICRDNYAGIGKPEPLKGDLTGCWSRRIDDANRLVYQVREDSIVIIQCKGHYEDK